MFTSSIATISSIHRTPGLEGGQGAVCEPKEQSVGVARARAGKTRICNWDTNWINVMCIKQYEIAFLC